MIPRDIFYERLDKHCKPCSEWDGVCLRGHALQSSTGCPLRKFDPIQATVYDEDKGRVVQARSEGGCGSCGAAVDAQALPPLSWTQVLASFAASMAQWAAAGLPTASSVEHDRRYRLCQACPQLKGFYCQLCKCVVYSKAKLATEYCPVGKW